jgi:hypothetical protein
MDARTSRTVKKRDEFIAALSVGKSVTSACIEAHLPRRTAYEWRDDDEDFRAAWDAAIDAGTDLLEDEAHRRAFNGTDKPVYQGGQMVGTIREYSDTLTIFLLKGRRPEKHRERASFDHNVKGTLSLLDVLGGNGSSSEET